MSLTDTGTFDEAYVMDQIKAYRNEADLARMDRKLQNRENYAQYNLKHDFSHKKSGQSTEILSKTKMAVESTRSFFVQALVDVGNWWRCYSSNEKDPHGSGMLITPAEIYRLTDHMLQRANFFSHIGNCVQESAIASLAIPKVGGRLCTKPKFRTKKEGRGKSYRKWVEKIDDKYWELAFTVIRGENYFPDPTGQGLYEIEEAYLDMRTVLALCEGEDAIYDKEAVESLVPQFTDDYQEWRKAQETQQNPRPGGSRPQVKITELWGNIVDRSSGRLMYENVVVTMANDTKIIRKPTPNPLWHQRSPIVPASLLELANSVWHTALMDAPVAHNRALTEIFNLILDSGMKAVYGLNTIRIDVLDDPKQIADGIPWGTNLKVRNNLAPGEKALEPLVTGDGAGEGMQVMNLLTQEFNAAALTSDLRSGGMAPRAVKATEVVEQSQSISSIMQGVSKNVEMRLVQPQLELSWMTIAQNWDSIDPELFKSLFGPERGEQMAQMEPQDVFTQTVNGIKFDVFGISLNMTRQQDYRKLTTLAQVVFGNPLLTEYFLKKYDPGKFLEEIMTTLSIDTDRLEVEGAHGGAPQGAGPQAQPGMAPGASPNTMSQVSPGAPPQAGGLGALFGMQQAGNGMQPNRGAG